MEFVANIIKGIFLGAGAILPGISSGVICVVFNIYDKLLESIFGIFKNFKQSFVFLFPLGLGLLVGVFTFGNILLYFYNNYPRITTFIFTLFIMLSFPALISKVHKEQKFKSKYLVYFVGAFLLTLIAAYFANLQGRIEPNMQVRYLILSGFFMSIGVVVPGVSSSMILILMGVYSTYLSAISIFNFEILIPMGIGLIAGCFIFMKIIQVCFKRFYLETFYMIMGFSLSSILFLNI